MGFCMGRVMDPVFLNSDFMDLPHAERPMGYPLKGHDIRPGYVQGVWDVP